MVKAIALHSVIPVRAEAKESAEQTTQMLFAETCEVLENVPRWSKIRIDTDKQEGWVDGKMITPMSDTEYRTIQDQIKNSSMVLFPMAYAVSENNGQTIPLTAGTRLLNYAKGFFEVLGVRFRIDEQMVATVPLEMTSDNLFKVVRFFLNTPYLWGGKNAFGMDCSGFTQVVLSLFGHHLLRNASDQILQGVEVVSLKEARAGDLAFFDHADISPDANHISHVGILLDSGRIVHCSGRVKVEKIDSRGIFSKEVADPSHLDGQYTHHLVSIRRLS